jgi:AcrR family transcriptional regulator
MRKGEVTKTAILDAALHMAAVDGLEGITIGELAERLAMSKSGVFARFGSREQLQLDVLLAYEEKFVDAVLRPALTQPRGLPRLRAIMHNWLEHSAQEAQTGCIWISGASEFDDKPGQVRDLLVLMVQRWHNELARAIGLACSEQHLTARLDTEQLVFELYGLNLVVHHHGRLLRNTQALARARESLERLFVTYGANPHLAQTAA